eukprot:5805362-Alexandrium_andersonii.AAC.1
MARSLPRRSRLQRAGARFPTSWPGTSTMTSTACPRSRQRWPRGGTTPQRASTWRTVSGTPTAPIALGT